MYKEFNLKYNPFAETRLHFPIIDRNIVRDTLRLRLGNAIDAKSCNMFFLLGDYGIGKSSILMDLENRIKGKSFFSEKKLLVSTIKMIHPKPPSNYTHYLYSEIMNSLGKSTFVKILKEVKEKKDTKILEEIDPDFRLALSLIDSVHSNISWEFLSGGNASLKDLSALGIKSKITDDETASKMLIEFLKVLKILDYQSLIVLVDEFEYIFTVAGAQKATQLVMTYRFIFDKINEQVDRYDNLTKMIFIFTSTPYSWDMLKQISGGTPFVDRVNEPIAIRPFSPDETEKMIKSRLNFDEIRISKEEGKIDLYPFKKDFIDFITNASKNGIPREIIKNCSLILDMAHQENIKEIGQEEAEKILKEWEKI